MVREARFVDTSILCDLLEVPGKCQQQEQVREELKDLVRRRVDLILPIAAIIETGNHIVQVGDGRARRACAERFVKLLDATAEGKLPWVLHAVAWDERMLRALSGGTSLTGPFVDVAGRGDLGAGDLIILAESELFAARTAGVIVRVWTHDQRLAAYNP